MNDFLTILLTTEIVSIIFVLCFIWLFLYSIIYTAVKRGTQKAIIEAHEAIKQKEYFKTLSINKTNEKHENKTPIL